jgi:hypothetical protein
MDREIELEHLRKADADIVKGRERIERQQALVARLKRDGHDVSAAMALLQTMQETLAVMEEHRRTILAELRR